MQKKVAILRSRLEEAWCAATSADPENWTALNPSKDQCAVTACVVQDELGGEIVWAEARQPDGETASHYFNRINGHDYDLTRDQFAPGTVVPEGVPKTKGHDSTRDYILSFEKTRERYELLKNCLG